MIKKVVLILIPLIVSSGSSCGNKKNEAAVEEKAVSVTVDIAARRDLAIWNVYTGTLEGVKQAQIFASIPEAVVDLPVPEGASVKSGQAIIYLDKNGTYSHYNQSKAVYLDARDNYDKMKKLFEQGAVSEQAYNGVKTAYEVAAANYTSAQQQVELTSPINGVLTDLSVNIGEFAPLGVALATVAQTDRMRMTLYVDAAGASNIDIGREAEIDVDILGQTSPRFTGTVTEVSRSADLVNRLFKVEVAVKNADGAIRPGMFARAQITVADLKSVLTIPKEAVFSVEGTHKAYLLKGGRASERTISIGESTREWIQVLSGLADGDTVIVLGRNLIEDGSLVKVATESSGSSGDEFSPAGSGSEG